MEWKQENDSFVAKVGYFELFVYCATDEDEPYWTGSVFFDNENLRDTLFHDMPEKDIRWPDRATRAEAETDAVTMLLAFLSKVKGAVDLCGHVPDVYKSTQHGSVIGREHVLTVAELGRIQYEQVGVVHDEGNRYEPVPGGDDLYEARCLCDGAGSVAVVTNDCDAERIRLCLVACAGKSNEELGGVSPPITVAVAVSVVESLVEKLEALDNENFNMSIHALGEAVDLLEDARKYCE